MLPIRSDGPSTLRFLLAQLEVRAATPPAVRDGDSDVVALGNFGGHGSRKAARRPRAVAAIAGLPAALGRLPVTTLGSQLTVVAVPYQVFRLTHSRWMWAWLGWRRSCPCSRLVVRVRSPTRSTDVGSCWSRSSPSRLAVSAGAELLERQAGALPLYALSALAAGFASIDSPTRSAVLANLVGRPMFVSADDCAPWQLLVQVVPGSRAGCRGTASRPVRHRVGLLDRRGHLAVSLLAVASLRPQPPGAAPVSGCARWPRACRYLKPSRPARNFVIT